MSSNDSSTEQLISWLNSAYAMEESLTHVLENHAKDAKDYPEVRARDEQHLAETRHHAEQVRQCLEILGEKPSSTKSALGNIMGVFHGASTGMYRDELVKNFLADYASEHFEIACYQSLIAAAEELGQPQIASICRDILRDEQDMADWLEDNIPEITRTYLQEQAAHTS